tara:strand:- start:53 stop:619 length:567 start_codon:yes stop_codon:yes gene_type:complete
MAEAHTDAYLSRPMTRAEIKLLSSDEKKERIKAQARIKYQNEKDSYKERALKSYYNNRETILKKNKTFYHENIEVMREQMKKYNKKYKQTPHGKKVATLWNWKIYGLIETPEELDRIYELYITQESCSSCDVKLTRDGVCSTQATMDHCHNTNRFRQVCCRACNIMDNWNKHWVDGVFGGSKLPRPPP